MIVNNDLLLEVANYFIDNQSTVRKTGKRFNISKSTIHKWLKSSKLKSLNIKLFVECDLLLKKNKEERAMRGGETTKIKYGKNKN